MEEITQQQSQPGVYDYIGMSIGHLDSLIKVYKSLSDRSHVISVKKEEDSEYELLDQLKKNILEASNLIVTSLIEQDGEDNTSEESYLDTEDLLQLLQMVSELSFFDAVTNEEYFYDGNEIIDKNDNIYTQTDLKQSKWKISNK